MKKKKKKKKTWLNGYLDVLSFYYNVIDTNDILDIHKHLR